MLRHTYLSTFGLQGIRGNALVPKIRMSDGNIRGPLFEPRNQVQRQPYFISTRLMSRRDNDLQWLYIVNLILDLTSIDTFMSCIS